MGAFPFPVERGYFLTAVLLPISPLLSRMAAKRSQALRLADVGVAGGLAGVTLLGAALQWQYATFIDFVLVKMPQYKQLMDGRIYPFTERDYLIPVAVTASTYLLSLHLLVGGPLREVLQRKTAHAVILILLVAFALAGAIKIHHHDLLAHNFPFRQPVR